MGDKFIAGLTPEALRVKLIGKGLRHRDLQIKVALREVVEPARCFDTTAYVNQLMKTARGSQERVNFAGKQRVEKESVKRSEVPYYWCSCNTKEPRHQHYPGKRWNTCEIIGHFSRACRSRGSKSTKATMGSKEAFANETTPVPSIGKKSTTKFLDTFIWFARERRKSSGHKLIPLLRVILYLKVYFTSCFLELGSRNRRLQLARLEFKFCTQRDK